MSSSFSFDITHRHEGSLARTGQLTTPHGTIETPNFIFCGTKATIKGLHPEQVKQAGADIILANTYHLYLQPGADLVAAHGGLHQFMQWDGPMLTDSGGYQIFSLGHGSVSEEIKGVRNREANRKLLKITEEGATFTSYLDGRIHTLTPEISIDVQRKLGADLIVVLDECPPYHVDRDYTARSMEMSHRWAIRSQKEFAAGDDGTQALYGIIHGGVYDELRRESAAFIGDQPFFGQAVGGCLGGTKEEMYHIVKVACEVKRPERPTHLLGIGGIDDIWNGAACGIDTFDCVHPTRLARHGGALVRPVENEGKQHINLRNSKFKDDKTPLDERLPISASRNFTKAYIHHLLKAGELLAGQLLALHNIAFMTELAKSVRHAIKNGTFEEERQKWI